MRIIHHGVTPNIMIYHWLLSIAGASSWATATSTTSATAVGIGRIRLVRLPTPTSWIHSQATSIRQAATIVTTVSPSAASTQVVPNGGKGRIKRHKKAGTVANYHIANVPAKIISNFYYSIRCKLAPAISILSSSIILTVWLRLSPKTLVMSRMYLSSSLNAYVSFEL